MTRLIPAERPFETLDDFLLHLHQWECTPPTLIHTQSEPFHEYEFYTNLWGKSPKVDEAELTFDAASHCFNHWSWTQYRLLNEMANQIDFNSRDVVAAMLFLITGREISQTK